jgi:hypothetical protein
MASLYVLIFSIQNGPEDSAGWMQTFFFTFGMDTLVFDPVSILATAIFIQPIVVVYIMPKVKKMIAEARARKNEGATVRPDSINDGDARAAEPKQQVVADQMAVLEEYFFPVGTDAGEHQNTEMASLSNLLEAHFYPSSGLEAFDFGLCEKPHDLQGQENGGGAVILDVVGRPDRDSNPPRQEEPHPMRGPPVSLINRVENPKASTAYD